MNDHDLLITVHEQIKNVRLDIKELKDGTGAKLADHETRIRKNEAAITTIKTWGAAGLVLITIIELILRFIYKN